MLGTSAMSLSLGRNDSSLINGKVVVRRGAAKTGLASHGSGYCPAGFENDMISLVGKGDWPGGNKARGETRDDVAER